MDNPIPTDLPGEAPSPAGASTAPTRVKVVVETRPGTRLEVEVEARAPDGRLVERHTLLLGGGEGAAPALPAARGWPLWARSVAARLRQLARLAAWQDALVWAALVVYALTRLIGLDAFPIYFFTDEAVQTVLAADFVRDGLKNYDQEFLPAQFENGAQYNLGTSVYLQVIPYLIFGKSIWVTRGTAALATLAAAFSVYAIARKVFRLRHAWLPVLVLSVTPTWFLHSRTAFETALATTFYALFLYFYLMYRCQNPRYLYGAVTMAALTFYTYNPARMVIVVSAVLLLAVDAPYHWRQRERLAGALGLAVLLALPYLRFLVNHPAETGWQMRLLGSYWIDPDLTTAEKIGMYVTKYLKGLNPLYWYLPHAQDLPRHTMRGYGHLGLLLAPLGLLGVGRAVYCIRQAEYRALLAAVLAAPAGAAMVEIGVTRALTLVIPMALLTALALAWVVEWAAARRKFSPARGMGAVFALLVVWNFGMLADGLRNGPTWYTDYGLAGMQYGARQLFGEVRRYLQANPGVKLIVSPSWANGTDVVARFFFNDPLPFTMGNADGYYSEERPLDDQTVFILTAEEYAVIPRAKFAEVRVEQTMSYPDGRPAFYFVRLKYAPNIHEILAAEAAERLKPLEETLLLDGVEVRVRYSRLDMGKINEALDGNAGTLVRTDRINPLLLELTFSDRRRVRQARLMVGGAPGRVVVQVWEEEGGQPVTAAQDLAQQPNPRYAMLDLGRELLAKQVRIELFSTMDGPDAHVHLWDVYLEP
mgnify:CR=1 FL=1